MYVEELWRERYGASRMGLPSDMSGGGKQMGLFSWLRGRRPSEPAPAPEARSAAEAWELVEPYVPAEPGQGRVASVIASAIAAGDAPDSEFVVRSVKVPNPEARLVTLIAGAIATGDRPESTMVVKRVFRKKSA